MSAVNPYQPPRADVADIVDESAEFEEPSPLTWRGRIGRLRYLAYVSGAYLLLGALMGVTGTLNGLSNGDPIGAIFFVIGAVAFLIFAMMAAIQRTHDMNLSGWWVLTIFIPLLNILPGLALIFWPGSPAGNRFGGRPTPNTWGVRILGCLLPAFFVVGVLAAISLPAYKSYQDRARAAQMQQQGK